MDSANSTAAASSSQSKVLGEKWIRIKDELKIKMSRWPPCLLADGSDQANKWREDAIKWINGITVSANLFDEKSNSSSSLTSTLSPSFDIIFPIGMRERGSVQFKIQMLDFRSISNPDASYDNVIQFIFPDNSITTNGLNVTSLSNYHRSVDSVWEIPTNLFGGIICNIVSAFGGKLEYTYTYTRNYSFVNHVFVKKQHLYPYFGTGAQVGTLVKGQQGCGKWLKLVTSELASSDNLLTIQSYRHHLFDTLSVYQCTRFIDLHFGNFGDFNRLGNFGHLDLLKMTKTARARSEAAQNFFANLRLVNRNGRRLVILLNVPRFQEVMTIPGKTMEEHLKFNVCDSWPDASGASDELTTEDIDAILHIFVEVHCGNNELKQMIVGNNSSTNEFPTLDDHFESFDEPVMRGLLTKTSAARKLAAHPWHIRLLHQDCSTSVHSIPTAVVDLMGSYFSPVYSFE